MKKERKEGRREGEGGGVKETEDASKNGLQPQVSVTQIPEVLRNQMRDQDGAQESGPRAASATRQELVVSEPAAEAIGGS